MRLACWAFCSQRLLVSRASNWAENEAHFGGKLHALFAQVLKIASELFIEEDDRFGAHETVLGAAEESTSRPRSRVAWRKALAEGSGGIGDAGAVQCGQTFRGHGRSGRGL